MGRMESVILPTKRKNARASRRILFCLGDLPERVHARVSRVRLRVFAVPLRYPRRPLSVAQQGIADRPPTLGYLIPEFPGQTHIFVWREIEQMRRLGRRIRLFSTQRPPAQ